MGTGPIPASSTTRTPARGPVTLLPSLCCGRSPRSRRRAGAVSGRSSPKKAVGPAPEGAGPNCGTLRQATSSTVQRTVNGLIRSGKVPKLNQLLVDVTAFTPPVCDTEPKIGAWTATPALWSTTLMSPK